jgi:hypothetical protein
MPAKQALEEWERRTIAIQVNKIARKKKKALAEARAFSAFLNGVA